jgi:uncharacterized protein (TIGR02996 family)
MSTLDALLRAIVADPQNEDRYLVLADYLEEYDDPRCVELLRLHRRLLATCREPERHPERRAWQGRIVALLAEGVRPCVPRRSVVLAEGVKMTFSFIPPGTFLKVRPAGKGRWHSDEWRHPVAMPRGFWLATYPVTQAQWRAVMGDAPSLFHGDALPVESVSWGDCQQFTGKLGKRFRLPNDAEWEYACRAGTTTPFFFGETLSTEQANYDGTSSGGNVKGGVYRRATTPVGTFPPNAWGLYDMHGNVWEWVADTTAELLDPADRRPRDECALCGGSWTHIVRNCSSASRFKYDPSSRFVYAGCRVVLWPDDEGS